MPKKRKTADKDEKPQCANCFVCVRDTEMCPLNENYNPDAYLKIAERLAVRQKKG